MEIHALVVRQVISPEESISHRRVSAVRVAVVRRGQQCQQCPVVKLVRAADVGRQVEVGQEMTLSDCPVVVEAVA